MASAYKHDTNQDYRKAVETADMFRTWVKTGLDGAGRPVSEHTMLPLLIEAVGAATRAR